MILRRLLILRRAANGALRFDSIQSFANARIACGRDGDSGRERRELLDPGPDRRVIARSNGDPFPVNPTEIRAIEVYAGTAGVPVEFQRMQSGGCGVIVIWTKRGGFTK